LKRKLRFDIVLCSATLVLAQMGSGQGANGASGAVEVVAEDDEPPDLSAQRILERVVSGLPREPLTIQGLLIVRRRHGADERSLNFEMHLRWGATPATARYIISDAFGRDLERLTVVRPQGSRPRFDYARGSPPVPADLPDLFSPIQESDLTWMDLTLSFLWWQGGSVTGAAEVRGRPCYVLDVPAPVAPSGQAVPGGWSSEATAYAGVRLWVDSALFMLLQAEGYDAEGTLLRRLWVKSFRKINDRWMIKDMEVQAYPAVHRTKLRIQEVELNAQP